MTTQLQLPALYASQVNELVVKESLARDYVNNNEVTLMGCVTFNNDFFFVFKVNNDYMNVGSEGYNTGEILFCSEIGKIPINYSNWDFVVVTKNNYMVRKIVDYNIENQTILLRSLNPHCKDHFLNINEMVSIFGIVNSQKKRAKFVQPLTNLNYLNKKAHR